MESRFERWVLVWMPVACGAVAWFVAERMPLEVLGGISLVGCAMVAGAWLAVGQERATALFRVSIHAGAAWAGAGVVQQFGGMWAMYLPPDPWLAVLAFPGAVVGVRQEIGEVLALTPWVAAAMTVVALCSAGSVVLRMGMGSGWFEGRGRGEFSGASRKQWMLAAVPVACGGAAWFFAQWMPVAVLAGVSLVGCAVVAATWLAVSEERSTALLRVSLYAGAGWAGVGVLQEFWAMWAMYLPANPWRAALALPGALVEVHRRLDGVFALTPWIAGTMTFFAAYFGLAVAAGMLFATGGVDEGRRQSGSELFGKSRLMGRRMMRRMSRGGGVILGVMDSSKRGELVSYMLVGLLLLLAPPRSGKTALIAANLLAPGGKGFVRGSNLIVDPRGELFFVAAKRRKAMGRNVVLVDPFAVVAKLADEFKGMVDVPTTRSATFNPLEFIRSGDEGMSDVFALLDGLLRAPARQGADNATHFYESAKAECAGKMAWVHRMGKVGGKGMLAFSQVRRWVTPSEREEKLMRDQIELEPNLGWGLPRRALERMDRVGEAERGSNFSTVANQLDWVLVPELAASTASSTFDPMVLSEGNTDLFLVVPESKLEISKAWLRMWVAVADAVPERKLKHEGITIVLDEAPRLGYLKPVMDALYMAAGKGIRIVVISQTESALESVYGREATRVMTDLLEVLQIVEFPRANPEFADKVSKMIGHATFVNTSKSNTGTVAGDDVLRREQSSQEGVNESLTKERLVTPEELMMLDVDEQVVVTNSKVAGREAMRLRLLRYWERKDMKALAAPNPYVLRMQAERRAA